MIHFERLCAYSRVMTDIKLPVHLCEGEFKDVSLTYDDIIAGITATYDFDGEVLIPDGEWKHFPQSFIENKYVQAWLAMTMNAHELALKHLKDEPEMKEYLDEDSSYRVVSTQMRVLYHMWSFHRHNERLYKVSSGLIDALEKADYPSTFDTVKAPFNEVFILFPVVNDFKMPVANKKLEGMYVNCEEVDEYTRVAILMTERPRSMHDILNEDVYFFEGYFKRDKPIDKSIEEGVSKMIGVSRYDKMNESQEVSDMIVRVTHFVAKLFLYMSSVNATVRGQEAPDRTEPKEKRLKKFLHREKSRKKFYQVGQDIVISSKSQEGSDGNTGNSTKHSHRYLVRGHWHSYWLKYEIETLKPHQIIDTKQDEFGTMAVKVKKFLAPYWRGPELGEVVLRDYKVVE